LENNVVDHNYGYINDATYRTEEFFGNTYAFNNVNYGIDEINTGAHRFWARTFLNKESDGTYDDLFAHPGYDPASIEVSSCDDVVHDISSRAAFVNGKITLGPRTVVTLSEDADRDTFIHGHDRGGSPINVHWYWLLRGIGEIHYNDNYDLKWWFRDQVDVSTGNYDMILAQGDWNIFYTTFHFKNAQAKLCDSENPKYVDSYLFVEDLGRKNSENAFSFQGGETVSDHNLSYETGAVTVKYYVNGGGSMTAPHLTDFSFWALAGSPGDDPPPKPTDTMPTNIILHDINDPQTTITTDEAIDRTWFVTSGGNVTSDNGAAITARGVCWSTSQEPTIADAHTADGTGAGSFTSVITGLASDTTYYVRAYATDSSGTFTCSDTFSKLLFIQHYKPDIL